MLILLVSTTGKALVGMEVQIASALTLAQLQLTQRSLASTELLVI